MPQNERVLTLIKGDKVGTTTDYRDQIMVNCTGIAKPILDVQGYIVECPGIATQGSAVGIDRGGIWNDQHAKLYRVSGSSFVEVSSTGVSTVRGTISASTYNAAFANSFNTTAIVSDGFMRLYSPSGGFVAVSDPDVGTPIDIVWIDGVYVLTDGQYVYQTDIGNETSINASKYATSEFSPDRTLGLGVTTDNKLIVFNRYTTEYFYNAANPNFMFSRIPSRNVNAGIVGSRAKCQLGGDWFFTGGPQESSISVYRLGVGVAEKISSREIDKILAQYSEPQLLTVMMESRSIDNYDYILLRLATETYMLNLTLAKAVGYEYAWSKLQSGPLSTDNYRGVNAIFDPRIGKYVCGDNAGSTLGRLDQTIATHYGTSVECSLHTPFTILQPYSIDQIEIQTIPGHTVVSDATVFLSLTYDGMTYTDEISLDYGGPAQYGQKFIANRCGYVPDWFGMKLRWVAQSRMAFSKATVRYS